MMAKDLVADQTQGCGTELKKCGWEA